MKINLNLLQILLVSWPLALPADILTNTMQRLEQVQMGRLAQQQNRPAVVIAPFRSDGCSGGMSHAWRQLADVLPAFGRAAGDVPPWEHCCVEHDRFYWRGEAHNGYAKRLQADEALRACVRQTGLDMSDELSRRLDGSPAEIEQLFNVASDMMFQAVRLGGGPCTGLAWRWGHGWPPCGLFAEQNAE